MMSRLLHEISIHSDRRRLILPPELDERDIASITDRKPEILKALRASQMNAAGFYTALPRSILWKLQASPWVALAIQTTAKTKFSVADRVSAETRVGDGTWMTYRAAHPGASLNTQPRIRILSLHTDDLGSCSWDLDALCPDDRLQLLQAAITRKTIVGHDVGTALSWLFTETDARPAAVLDSMLLVRHLRPGMLLRPFAMALDKERGIRTKARELIEREGGGPKASLEWVATSMRLPVSDIGFKKSTSWSPTELSEQHRAFAADTVALPLSIVRYLLPDLPVMEMSTAIQGQYPWHTPFATATVLLAESHVRGIPFDLDAAGALRSDCVTDIERAAEGLIKSPEFAPLHASLCNPRVGVTAELKSALAEYTNANGISAHHVVATHSANVCSTDPLPCETLLHTVQENKEHCRTIERYGKAASRDGRMHSLITFAAATGRNNSCEPSLQNVPRDPRFRGLIRARPGHLILAADYAAIELRIAAVLAERAVSDLRERVKRVRSSNDAHWFIKLVRDGARASRRLYCPPEPVKWNLKWLNAAIPAVAQTVLRRDRQMMMSIFHRDLDPHLVTAVDMAGRQGKVDCGQNALEWLTALDEQARGEIKLALHAERQQAKPANFGLLYGIGEAGLHQSGIDGYGLSWTHDEAGTAREAWFALYPEFRLWHFWTKYMQSREVPSEKCLVWNSFERRLVEPKYPLRLFETTTISGRPFAILDNFKQALNYQSQGTGADILAVAIARLPQAVSQMLLIPVHDELVFEVPVNEIGEVRTVVADTMILAADEVLGGQLPIKVEPKAGDTWGKA